MRVFVTGAIAGHLRSMEKQCGYRESDLFEAPHRVLVQQTRNQRLVRQALGECSFLNRLRSLLRHCFVAFRLGMIVFRKTVCFTDTSGITMCA